MIGTICIGVNAAHPNIALATSYTFKGSPSSFRITEVPTKIGSWKIEVVRVSVTAPDNTQTTVDCKKVGDVWVGTVDGTQAVGEAKGGIKITADGIDENGNSVVGYVLGIGDFVVIDVEEPTPIVPTRSGVKFTDGGFLEIQNSNANIWHQSQSAAMYFFPLAGRPIGGDGYIDNVEEVTILDSGTGNALQAIMTPTTCKRVYIGPNWYFTINNMFQYATSLEEVIFIGRTMEQVQQMDGYPWGIDDATKIKTI